MANRSNARRIAWPQPVWEIGVKYLGHLMGPPNENAADIDVNRQRSLNMRYESIHKGEWDRLIKSSPASGHPVGFSPQDNKYGDRLRQRMLPGHKHTIVGTATRDNKKGYLVFDPHSISVGPNPQRNSTNHSVTYQNAQRGNSPAFFVGVDETFDLFDHLLYSYDADVPLQNNDELMRV
jgi:hypothetical protein